MSKVDKLINEALEESIGVNAGQLSSDLRKASPRSNVTVVDKNGKEYSISYTEIEANPYDGTIDVYLFVV